MSKPITESITQSQYFEYMMKKDLLKSGLKHLKKKEEDENGDATENTGLPKHAFDRLIDTLARKMTGIPLDNPISTQPPA